MIPIVEYVANSIFDVETNGRLSYLLSVVVHDQYCLIWKPNVCQVVHYQLEHLDSPGKQLNGPPTISNIMLIVRLMHLPRKFRRVECYLNRHIRL